MTTERSATETYYECLDCGNRVPHVSYRASCPACGGEFRPIPPPLGRP